MIVKVDRYSLDIITLLSFCNNTPFIGIEVFKRDASALGDAEERAVGDFRLYARAATDELGEVAQLRGAAGEDDALVNDVRRKFRRRILEHVFYRFYHLAKLPRRRRHKLIAFHRNRTRQTALRITAFDFHHQLLFKRQGRADGYFDVFRGLVANAKIEMLFGVIGDGVVEPITRAFHGVGRDDAAKRDDRDINRATADVNDHVPARLVNGDARADGREDRLFHHIRVARAGFQRGFHHGAPFGRGDARRHRNHHFRLKNIKSPKRLFQEIPKHRFRHAVVRYHAVFHRAVRADMLRRPPDHLFRFLPHRENFIVV